MSILYTVYKLVEHALDLEEWPFSAVNDGTCKESLVLVKRRGLAGPPDNIKTKSLSLSLTTKTLSLYLKQHDFLYIQTNVASK